MRLRISIWGSVRLSVCPSVHSSVPPSVHTSNHLSIRPSYHLSVHWSIAWWGLFSYPLRIHSLILYHHLRPRFLSVFFSFLLFSDNCLMAHTPYLYGQWFWWLIIIPNLSKSLLWSLQMKMTSSQGFPTLGFGVAVSDCRMASPSSILGVTVNVGLAKNGSFWQEK